MKSRLFFFPFALNVSQCVSAPHREHDQVHRKPRQPAFSHPHDHPRPGERGQGLAPGQEPRARRPEGGRPRQQDGLGDLPDATPGHQGEAVGERRRVARSL